MEIAALPRATFPQLTNCGPPSYPEPRACSEWLSFDLQEEAQWDAPERGADQSSDFSFPLGIQRLSQETISSGLTNVELYQTVSVM